VSEGRTRQSPSAAVALSRHCERSEAIQRARSAQTKKALNSQRAPLFVWRA
jgi:hypothetical protein